MAWTNTGAVLIADRIAAGLFFLALGLLLGSGRPPLK